jgi:hypothetical protein
MAGCVGEGGKTIRLGRGDGVFELGGISGRIELGRCKIRDRRRGRRNLFDQQRRRGLKGKIHRMWKEEDEEDGRKK